MDFMAHLIGQKFALANAFLSFVCFIYFLGVLLLLWVALSIFMLILKSFFFHQDFLKLKYGSKLYILHMVMVCPKTTNSAPTNIVGKHLLFHVFTHVPSSIPR